MNAQVKFFSNVGQEKWAVLMDHIHYDGERVRKVNNNGYAYYIHAKQAYIDSGNSSIQLPYTDFQFIKQRMQWNETSIDVRRVPNTVESQQRYQLYSVKSCSDIEKNVGSLEFFIQNQRVRVSAKGLLYQQTMAEASQEKSNSFKPICRIGIESIPDSANQYRLGIQFLRNFFVQLDYDQNLIVIGLNKNGLDANSGITFDPEGRNTAEPEIPRYSYEALVNFMAFFLILTGIGLIIFIKKYKESENQQIIAENIDAPEYSAKFDES